MPAQNRLFHDVLYQIRRVTASIGLRQSAVTRLALLVTGIIAARSCVLAQVAAELRALRLTRAEFAASIERRLRRTLNDERLPAATCSEPLVPVVLAEPALVRGRRHLTVIVDETTQEERMHLLRVSLAYWGGALPLAWVTWPQNRPLPDGAYWQALDQVLTRVARLLPTGGTVTVVADRAYDGPAFVDRVQAHGWHWVVRTKANSALRFRDQRGREAALAEWLRVRVRRPGQRWKARGQVFKKADWRTASVIAVWAPGQRERLVVLSDLPPRWDVIAQYGRRPWTEPGFRDTKSAGWNWEASQVTDPQHQQVLLTAMAWASLVTLCLGIAAAQARLAARAARTRRRDRPAQPAHARASVFRLGLQAARAFLYRTTDVPIRWLLPEVDSISWNDRWRHCQMQCSLRETVRP